MKRRRAGIESSRITREGAVFSILAVGMLGAGFVQRGNLLILAAAMMGSLASFAFLLARSNLRGLAVRRRLPFEVFAGQVYSVQFEVRSRRRMASVWGSWAEEQSPKGLTRRLPRIPLGEIPPGQPVTFHYEATAVRRGLFRFESLLLKSTFPFGLFERSVKLECPGEMIVYPRLGVLKDEALRPMREGASDARSISQWSMFGQEDFHHLREYRPGDDPRRIHWRTTARRGKAVIMELDSPASDELTLLVEPHLAKKSGATGAANLEALLSLAATICVEWIDKPNRWFCLAIAGVEPVVVSGASSRRLLERCLRELALTTGQAIADVGACLRSPSFPRRINSRLWIATSRESPPAVPEGTLPRGPSGRASLVVTTAENLDQYFAWPWES